MWIRHHLATLGLAASLVAVLGGPAAGAKDTHVASVLGANVVLSIPKGYCALDKNSRADNQPLSLLEEANTGRNIILLMFADCKQLQRFRTTGQSLSNSGVYMAPASARHPVKMPRARFVTEIASAFKRQRQLVDQGHEEGKRRVSQQDVGVEVEQVVNLGLLHSDDTAAYTGIVQTLQVEGSGKVQVAIVTGITLVRERVISVNLSADYSGHDTVTGLLAAQRELVKALIAAN
ncbi:MAG TPA: hypothetical protein VLG10_02900 [Methylomirabilota bacterium]|nr:hypothetical protein [Methylomirabilota bacterium]